MYPEVNCDFVEDVEDTERGKYCCLDHITCHSEDCEILKNGLGEEDIKQAYDALWEIMSNMNK